MTAPERSGDDLLFAEEMERDYRLPASTWRYFYSVGKGPKATKLGRRLLWKRADVEAWISAQNMTKAGA
jgi:predicted DNA-binding transcriptional regulator AlpA